MFPKTMLNFLLSLILSFLIVLTAWHPTSLFALEPQIQSRSLQALSSERATGQAEPSERLSPIEIFAHLSPSVPFIQTPTGMGSGILLEDGYVLTNAHIVWPFTEVRVAFPDGTEFIDAPVINWDLMADFALIGPLDTQIDPITLSDFEEAENYSIGSEVYLIGYPGEFEPFPQPTFSRGLFSRLRRWESMQINYIQSDAPMVGGQSGGILISERGTILGISGWAFADTFAFATSAADILPRIEALIAGEDADALDERVVPTRGRQRNRKVQLDNLWDRRVFVLNEPADTEVELQIDSESDAMFRVVDAYGEELLYVDDELEGIEEGSLTLAFAAPHFVIVDKWDSGEAEINLKSSHRLALYHDNDDGITVTPGETVAAAIDYPGDMDYFLLELKSGEIVDILADSIAIDPYLTVDNDADPGFSILSDDDSGGGLFGLNATLTFEAPEDATYLIIVRDARAVDAGGYQLTVEKQ